MGHTQQSFSEPLFVSHFGTGIEIAAGVTASAACGVTPPTGGVDEEVSVGGNVPTVLALTLGQAASLGTFMPGVDRDYTGSLAGTVTSSAAAAALTVRDPSANAPGRLVNGSSALAQPLQVKAGSGAFAPLGSSALPLTTFTTPVGARPVTIDFKQSIAATDALLTGAYGKTLVFTLTATTP